MKRLKFLLPLVIVLAGGVYFLFFYEGDLSTEGPTDAVEQIDSVPAEPEEPAMDPVERVRMEEMANFADFLEVQNDTKKKLIGKLPVRGSITNNAGLAIFKDIQLEIVFLNDLGTELGKEYMLIQEYVDPGESLEFEEKYQAPKGTATTEITITDAKAVSEVPSNELPESTE